MQRYRMSDTASRRGSGGGCWMPESRLRLHGIQGDMPKIDSQQLQIYQRVEKSKIGDNARGLGVERRQKYKQRRGES